MYAKVIDKWQKSPPQDMIKWAKFSANMVKYYERQLTKTGRTKIGDKGYGISMHTTEDLTDGDSLTEAVSKYAERATQAE